MFIVSSPFLVFKVLSGNKEIFTGIELPDTLDECRLSCLRLELNDHELIALEWRESIGVILLELVECKEANLENRNIDPIVVLMDIETGMIIELLSFRCKIGFHVIEDTLFEVLWDRVH